jgi:hypothetical protein
MSFFGKLAEQAKTAAMAQIPAAIQSSKPQIIEAIKSYIQKNPSQGPVIKQNLSDIAVGIQTAGTRRHRKVKKTKKAGRRRTVKH